MIAAIAIKYEHERSIVFHFIGISSTETFNMTDKVGFCDKSRMLLMFFLALFYAQRFVFRLNLQHQLHRLRMMSFGKLANLLVRLLVQLKLMKFN